MLSRTMAMRCSSSERESELPLLILLFPGQAVKAIRPHTSNIVQHVMERVMRRLLALVGACQV
jgi:hypothetical protein